MIVSGKGRNHAEPHYGCPMNAFRNTCSDSLRIRKDILEKQLLEKLQTEVLREEVVDYTLSRFEEELRKAARNIGGQMARLEAKKAKLEKKLRTLRSNWRPSLLRGITPRLCGFSSWKKSGRFRLSTMRLPLRNQTACVPKLEMFAASWNSSLTDIRKLLNSVRQSRRRPSLGICRQSC